ncbi:ABC transporter permease subunit [Clostridium bovifaecis]|uniref:ABC transporter permease subunit n=1 Tax=Clostridium bovifaecis TaxID=2184719 RepID=A0A6I6F0Q8_9CLOT|nr:ABC transporter permease subunit [Clostridium bovifaecis]
MNNSASIVFKKELKDLLRDRKTFLVSIIIPLILFPLIFFAIGKAESSNEKSIEENFRISIKGGEGSQFLNFIKQDNKIKILDSSNLEEDVKDGKLLLALEVPEDVDELIKNEKQAAINIIYDNSSQQSIMAQEMIENYIEGYSKQIVATRLEKRGMDSSLLTPIKIDYRTTSKEDEGFGKMILSMLVPMLLVLYSVTGPMGPAVDLGAGEKERGTLEPLLTTQAGRMSLLWGKFGAIAVIGFLTTLASIAGIVIVLYKGGAYTGGMNVKADSLLSMGLKGIVLIFFMVILLNLVFASLELSISIYARSFKEAQTYLAPLNIIALVPVYTTYMLDARNIDTYYFHIPISNAVCLIKEFLAGVLNTNHILITFGWIIVYIAAAILFARYMFSKEEVIFRT